jgi:hypothetical protein
MTAALEAPGFHGSRSFDNPEWVKLELGAELGVRPELLEARADEGFVAPAWDISRRDWEDVVGPTGWRVVRSHEDERQIARDLLAWVFKNEPDFFKEEVIEMLVDQDALRDVLRSRLLPEVRNQMRAAARNDIEWFWEYFDQAKLGKKVRTKEWLPEPDLDDIERASRHEVEKQIRHPVSAVVDRYGRSDPDGIREAARLGRLDPKKAAEAVLAGKTGLPTRPGYWLYQLRESSDPHGRTYETPSLYVFWEWWG